MAAVGRDVLKMIEGEGMGGKLQMQPQSRHLQGFSPGDLPSHRHRTLGFYTHQKSLRYCSKKKPTLSEKSYS
jgi:hypothetical protein